MTDAVDDGVEADLRREFEAASDVALSAPEGREIDGGDDGLEAGGGGPADHLLDETPVLPHVDLEPVAALVDRRDLFDRAGAEGRQGVGEAGPTSGAGHREFAFGVGDAGEPGGDQHERKRERATEQGGRRVDHADVAQDPGHELKIGERRHAAGEGPLVFGRAVDVVEHPAGQPPFRHRPQVGDVRGAIDPSVGAAELEASEADRRAERVEDHDADRQRRR